MERVCTRSKEFITRTNPLLTCERLFPSWKSTLTWSLVSIFLIEHDVTPSPHGNSRQSNSYVRTKESTVNMLRDESAVKPPKAAYHTVHKESGGILNASSVSDLPRNRSQAKYLRRGQTEKRSFDQDDSLVIL